MEIKIVHALDDRSRALLAYELIRDKVFHEDGSMIDNLLRMYQRKRLPKLIVLGAQSEVTTNYIGSLFYFINKREIHVFVKEEFQRKGIAQRLVDELRTQYKLERIVFFSWGPMGIEGRMFFEKNFIYTYNPVIDCETYRRCLADGNIDRMIGEMNRGPIAELRKKLWAKIRAER